MTALPTLLRPLSVAAARLQGTGLPRLSEALRRHYQRQWPGQEIRVDNFQGDLRLAVDLRDEMGSRIFWFDAYSRSELKLLGRLLSPGDVFIDVGANIGEFSLTAARLVGTTGRVIAVEPVPFIRAKLERHVQWNDLGLVVTVVPDAIGDTEGGVPIFAPPDDAPERHEGLPTLFASSERPSKIAEAHLTTLDLVAQRLRLDRVTGIKLDIEGAELKALHGAADTLKRFRPWLLCEIGANTCEAASYAPWDIVELMMGLGYRVSEIRETGLKPIRTQQDLGPWQNVLAEPANGA